MGTSWNAFVPPFVRLSVQHQLLSGDDNELVELTNKNLRMRRAGLSGDNTLCVSSFKTMAMYFSHLTRPLNRRFITSGL